MQARAGLVIAAAIGLTAGLLAGQVWEVLAGEAPRPAELATTSPGPGVERAPVEAAGELRAPEPAPPAEPERRRVEDEPAAPEGTSREAADDEVLIGPALERHAREGLAAGWAELRGDPLPDEREREGLAEFVQLVETEPRAIGRRLAELQTKRDVAEGTLALEDPIKLLKALAEPGVGPVLDLAGDPERFGELFRREHPASFAAGPRLPLQADEAVEDGTVVRFPAGVFELKTLMRHKHPFPRDVALQGAGMNATLLVIPELSTRGAVRSFAIRDCTVHTDDNYLFDLRLEPATLEFERVRLVGFDVGAGGSCLLGTKETAVRMADCIVSGGYGRNPRYGTLFDIRTPALLGRFERCTFQWMRIGLSRARPGATVVFAQCKFQDVYDDPVADAEDRTGLVLQDCLVVPYEGDMGAVPRRDLEELFPGWRAELGRQ